MQFIYHITIFLFLFPLPQVQDVPNGWTTEQISMANTAAKAGYLSEEEKKVILIANLARIDGELFSETYLDPYLADEKSTKYTRSLYRELKKVKDFPVFLPEEDLFSIALNHAEVSGKRGTVGHQRFEKRFKPLMWKYREVAENCAYGYSDALDIVIRLLIDEGIDNLGHRKNLLNPKLNRIGVSIKPHKNFRMNCVMDFGAIPE